MEADSFLLTAAQAGLAMAGFSALISAFRRTDLQLSPIESMNRAMILEMGMGTSLFALLPFPIEKILTDILGIDKGVWRISSFTLAIFMIGWGVFTVMRILEARKLYPVGEVPFPLGFILLMFSVVSFLGLNALLPSFGSVSIYEIGLIWMLVIAGIQFLGFVHVSMRHPGS